MTLFKSAIKFISTNSTKKIFTIFDIMKNTNCKKDAARRAINHTIKIGIIKKIGTIKPIGKAGHPTNSYEYIEKSINTSTNPDFNIVAFYNSWKQREEKLTEANSQVRQSEIKYKLIYEKNIELTNEARLLNNRLSTLEKENHQLKNNIEKFKQLEIIMKKASALITPIE